MKSIRSQVIKTVVLSTLFLLAGVSSSYAAVGKVLVVLSGVDYVSVKNAPNHQTGFFLVELAGPLAAIKNAGFEVVYANPNGIQPVMDKVSDDVKWFKDEGEYQKAKSLVENETALKAPRLLSSFKQSELKSFDGIFLPGGHAPMEDLYKDKDLGKILRYFHAASKPTALICHAPVALLSAQTKNGWIYSGYNMTVFSNTEEKIEEANGVFGGKLNYYVQDALTHAGGNLQVATEWASRAVRDRELITGQNPMSEQAFTKLLIEALIEQKLRNKQLRSWTPESGEKLPVHRLLNVMNTNVNWSEGYTTLYVGKKQKQITDDKFLPRMEKHVAQVRSKFQPLGLRGYIVYLGNDYEIAYQNWASKDAATSAFASTDAQEIFQDAGTLLDNGWFEEMSQLPAILLSLAYAKPVTPIEYVGHVAIRLCAKGAVEFLEKKLAEEGRPIEGPAKVSEVDPGWTYSVTVDDEESSNETFVVSTYDMREEDGTCPGTHYR